MNPVLQSESSECGLACIAMVASHYGHNTDLSELRRQFSASLKGATLAQRKVNFSLGQLLLTRIMVAHRPETINTAGRVVALRDGLAVEVRSAVSAEQACLAA